MLYCHNHSMSHYINDTYKANINQKGITMGFAIQGGIITCSFPNQENTMALHKKSGITLYVPMDYSLGCKFCSVCSAVCLLVFQSHG